MSAGEKGGTFLPSKTRMPKRVRRNRRDLEIHVPRTAWSFEIVRVPEDQQRSHSSISESRDATFNRVADLGLPFPRLRAPRQFRGEFVIPRVVCALASGEAKERKQRGSSRISHCHSSFPLCRAFPHSPFPRRSLAHITAIAVPTFRARFSRASFLLPLRQCGTLLLRDSVHTYTCGHAPQQASRNKLKYFTRFPPGPPRRNPPPCFLAPSGVTSASSSGEETARFLHGRAVLRELCHLRRFERAFLSGFSPVGLNVIKRSSNYRAPVSIARHAL